MAEWSSSNTFPSNPRINNKAIAQKVSKYHYYLTLLIALIKCRLSWNIGLYDAQKELLRRTLAVVGNGILQRGQHGQTTWIQVQLRDGAGTRRGWYWRDAVDGEVNAPVPITERAEESCNGRVLCFYYSSTKFRRTQSLSNDFEAFNDFVHGGTF